MKDIITYIQEGFKLGKNKVENKIEHKYFPKNKWELQDILRKRLTEDKNANLNDIDVSKVSNMFDIFDSTDPHNIDISEWDVSNVKNMSMMFFECKNFNCDLSDWDVSNVVQFDHTFYGCKKFTGKGLENWNVSNVEYMVNMFDGCDSLKNIPSWYES